MTTTRAGAWRANACGSGRVHDHRRFERGAHSRGASVLVILLIIGLGQLRVAMPWAWRWSAAWTAAVAVGVAIDPLIVLAPNQFTAARWHWAALTAVCLTAGAAFWRARPAQRTRRVPGKVTALRGLCLQVFCVSRRSGDCGTIFAQSVASCNSSGLG